VQLNRHAERADAPWLALTERTFGDWPEAFPDVDPFAGSSLPCDHQQIGASRGTQPYAS
jgi:hypothetical protein